MASTPSAPPTARVVVYCRRPWLGDSDLLVFIAPVEKAADVTAALQSIWDVLDCDTMEHVLLTVRDGLLVTQSVYGGAITTAVDTFVRLAKWDVTPTVEYLQFHPTDTALVQVYEHWDPKLKGIPTVNMSLVTWDY